MSLRQVTDQEIEAAIKVARSWTNLKFRLGLSGHDWYELKRRAAKFDTSHFMTPRKTPSDDEFRAAVARSWSIEALRIQLGYTLGGSIYEKLKKRLVRLGFTDADFCAPPPRGRGGSRPLSREEVFRKRDCKRKPRAQSGMTLRAALLREGREFRCTECGLGPKWNGKPLTLQVDHINGDRYDDRFENLRFLCPNCHTQTPTFCGRNTRQRPEPALRLIKGGASEA